MGFSLRLHWSEIVNTCPQCGAPVEPGKLRDHICPHDEEYFEEDDDDLGQRSAALDRKAAQTDLRSQKLMRKADDLQAELEAKPKRKDDSERPLLEPLPSQ